MKKLLFIFIAASILIGCKCPQIVTSTVYKDSIVYKERFDSIDVPLFVPKSGISLNHKLPPGLPLDYKAEGSKKDNNRTASYKIDSGNIIVNCDEEAHMDTIKNLRVKLYDTERRLSEKKTVTVEKKVEVFKTPTWVKWLIAIEVGIILLIGAIKGWWKGPISWIKKGISFLIKLFV